MACKTSFTLQNGRVSWRYRPQRETRINSRHTSSVPILVKLNFQQDSTLVSVLTTEVLTVLSRPTLFRHDSNKVLPLVAVSLHDPDHLLICETRVKMV